MFGNGFGIGWGVIENLLWSILEVKKGTLRIERGGGWRHHAHRIRISPGEAIRCILGMTWVSFVSEYVDLL